MDFTVNCPKELNLEARKRSAEELHVVCMCAQITERGGRLKYNILGLIYAFGFLGPLLQTECIHCAYSKFTLQNDLHLSYLRSSGIVQGGSSPCSSKSFGSHALLAAAHNLGWGIWAGKTSRRERHGILIWSRQGFVKLDESHH